MDVEAPASQSCVVTLTPKADPGSNEDAAAVLAGDGLDFHAIAVADGLGSYTHGGDAARFVIDRTADLAKTLKIESAESLSELFSRIRKDLRDHVRNLPIPPFSEAGSYGTTLLVAAETPNQLIAAYTGNGGIWHMRGNFDDSAGPTRIPWCAVNYLRPHSILVEGKERLYNLIDLFEQLDSPPPTVITVNKDLRFGDIFVLCTDGIYSADQALHGTDTKGDLWIGAGAAMVALYECLRSYFSQPCGGSKLEEAMQQYLQDLKDRDLLEDDATIGIIVTGAALAHQQRKRRSVPGG